MESLESLKNKKRQLEYELDKITIKKHGSTHWAPGVYDQHKSESYSYDEYTDSSKAYKLKDEIEYLTHQIETYAKRAREEREAKEFWEDNQRQKYSYTQGGERLETTNPAIAARYNAQHRFFGMSKVRQTMAKINGQYGKFKKLWDNAQTISEEKQQEYAEKLNKLFR